jgi:hypothetical protein
MYLRRQGEEHVTSSCRNQPGGLGKHAGRSIKRTDAAPKSRIRRLLLVETGIVSGDSIGFRGSLESLREHNGMAQRTAGVRSTARMEGTAAKVGKVPRVAEALPHSEGAAYKGYAAKSQRACGTGRWGRTSDDGARQHNSHRSRGPLGQRGACLSYGGMWSRGLVWAQNQAFLREGRMRRAETNWDRDGVCREQA